ncbi:hypothetical protein BH24ACT3_BH24ACT3_11590 [soil metagenome]
MIEIIAAVLAAVVAVGVVILLARRRSGAGPTAGSSVAPPASSTRHDPLSRLVEGLRRRRWARWTLSGVAFAMAATAIGVIGYPFYTNVIQNRIQSQLDRQLASSDLRQEYIEGRVAEGDSLTRIKIPAIDVDVVVVEGTTSDALRAGAGHYPESPLPCEVGNVAIAGHRTTYGRPFHDMDRLEPGDAIILETPIGSCTYEIRDDPFIVAPTELSVLDPTANPSLTLTTCHPKGSAAQRMVLHADMVSAEIEQS